MGSAATTTSRVKVQNYYSGIKSNKPRVGSDFPFTTDWRALRSFLPPLPIAGPTVGLSSFGPLPTAEFDIATNAEDSTQEIGHKFRQEPKL